MTFNRCDEIKAINDALDLGTIMSTASKHTVLQRTLARPPIRSAYTENHRRARAPPKRGTPRASSARFRRGALPDRDGVGTM